MQGSNSFFAVSPYLILFFPVVLLIIPIPWICAAVCSIVIHEACHILVARLLGKRIACISINSDGAEILMDNMSCIEELIVAAAGPCSCIFALFLAQHFPRFAVCSVVHSLYNLLPLYPSDGGRMIYSFAKLLFSANTAQKLYKAIEKLFWILIFFAAAVAIIFCHIGPLPVATGAILVIRQYKRKNSCKDDKLRVQ